MNNLLIVLGLGLFGWLASRRKDWGIYLIILLLPAYQIRFVFAGIPMTFLEGMIVILAAVEFFKLVRKTNNPLSLSPLYKGEKVGVILIFFFLLAAFLSIFVSSVPVKAAGIFKAYFFEAVLFYFLVILIIDTPQKLQGVFRSLAFLVLYLSAFGIYQFFTLANLPFSWWAVDVASRRITSLLNHPNALALLLGPILALLIMFRSRFLPLPSARGGRRGGDKEGVLYWSAIILGLIALYLTFSRAAWLALIVTIIGFGLLSYNSPSPPLTPSFSSSPLVGEERWGGKRGGRGALLLLVIVIILAIPFSRLKLLELARRTDPSQQNRIVLWSAASDMLKKSPIYGLGLMGFHEAYKNYPLGPDRVVQNYPHNFFLNFWVEIGLVGFLAMLGLLYLFYKKIWAIILLSPGDGERSGERSKKSLALAAAAGMTMILLHGLVDVSYFKNDLSVLFWLIYALPNLSLNR